MPLKNKLKLSQVWVETVVYILIGLTIIAILLSIVSPQIERIKDKGIIKQTMDAMDILDNKIADVEQSPGSIGIVNFKVAKGMLMINSTNESIQYLLEDSILEFSEVGNEIKEGNYFIKTEKRGNRFDIYLKRYYTGLDFLYSEDANKIKIMQSGATPYKISLENKGQAAPALPTQIDFNVL